MKKNIYLLLIFLSLGNSSEFELFGASTLKPFYGFNNSQIISNSLGNATVAAGFLTPGLSSNPANFAANKLSTLHLNYSNNEFDGSSTISNSNFNGFDVVAPFKVYRGSFALSGGRYTNIDQLLVAKNSNETLNEEGELSTSHLGAAVEFAKNIYIGIDLKFISGDNNYQLISDYPESIKSKYDGFTYTIGILHRYSNLFQYGISIDMPTVIDIRENYNGFAPDGTENKGIGKYEAEKPITFHAGTAIFLKNKPFGDLNLLYELEFTDWSSLKVNSSDPGYIDKVELNQSIRENAQKTISHHFGAMYQIPKFPLQILVGYEHLPTPYANNKYKDNLRQNYSLGFSFMMHKKVNLQLGYNNYKWTYDGINESYERLSIGISLYSLFSLAN